MEHECPWQQQSPKLAFFSIKVMVKVTRSFALVSYERVSLVEYACQISSLYLLQFKSYIQGQSFFFWGGGHRHSHRQTDRQTGQKPEVPQSPDARLSQAFVVRGFISMISKVKMQEKIQKD